MSANYRSAIIAGAKHMITHGISLLREVGMNAEEVAAVVFACSMGSSSSVASSAAPSSSSSVAGDVVSDASAKRKPGRPKKERDPDAPKKELPAGLVEANAKGRKWFDEVYMPSWETRKDEWRELYGRIPIKKDAKRARADFPEDRAVGVQMGLAMYKLLFGPSDDQKKAAAAAKKSSSKSAKVATAAPAPVAQEDAADSKDDPEFFQMTLNSEDYIYDELNNCWHLTADGSKGDWAGIYDPETRMIDDTADEPSM